MRYLDLKISGCPVPASRIVMGSCYFGTRIVPQTAEEMLDFYVRQGGTVIDTAHSYAFWEPGGTAASEKTIGRWIQKRGVRKELLVATKGGLVKVDGKFAPDLDPVHLRAELEDSLRNLGTSYVDLYWLHRDDRTQPAATFVDILDTFYREGKILAAGVSNWETDRIEEANQYAARTGKIPILSSQILWNPCHSTPESWGDDTIVAMTGESARYYRDKQMPVMAFASQGKGFFSKAAQVGIHQMTSARAYSPDNVQRFERVMEICRQTGVNPSAVVLGYITGNPVPGLAIVGCSSLEQLKDCLLYPDFVPTPEMLQLLDQ